MDKQQENTWAVVSHIGALIGVVVPFGNILLPLLIWLGKKNESAFIAANAKESLNFQISVTIYTIIAAILAFLLIGIPLLLALLVLEIVCVIKASIAASNSKEYKYPLTIRFVK